MNREQHFQTTPREALLALMLIHLQLIDMDDE